MSVKISELVELENVSDSDVLPIVDTQNEGTRKITFANLRQAILEVTFPVGATYTTQNDTNPSEILGFGTWERLKGKVVVGLDEDDTDFNIVGQTGGEKTHILTTEEMPAHAHNVAGTGASNSGYISMYTTSYDSDRSLTTTSAGGGQAHNNLQPYYVTGYMWIRKS